ncbi:hypothetical protein [Leifsonia sp. Root112D2]|uniref:hypothetical protein n=1 Tax=Leifsonia sp. Root112D2 TaxID=1736426 RepID=UPI0006F2C637|nr:hypothetical protein [Leifsonia sp. Root112D2]KQV07081.1 hypothetical protein ASC63_07050 [Leifsonia sp. Root112D2]
MAVNKQALVAAVAKFRADTPTAVKFADSDLTKSAITRRRHTGVMAARGELRKHLPAEPEAPKVDRSTVIAGLTPATADAVAVQARELAIVQKLLDSGRVLKEVVRGASPERLAAIAANAEVFPEVLRSDDPASVVRGIHERVFDALAESGHPQAVIARDAQAQFDEQAARREVIADTIEGRETGGGLTALFSADPEGFEALMAANTEPVVNADTVEAVRKLDRTFGIDTGA